VIDTRGEQGDRRKNHRDVPLDNTKASGGGKTGGGGSMKRSLMDRQGVSGGIACWISPAECGEEVCSSRLHKSQKQGNGGVGT